MGRAGSRFEQWAEFRCSWSQLRYILTVAGRIDFMSRPEVDTFSSHVEYVEPSKITKPKVPKIVGFDLPLPRLCLALYPPIMWLLQKVGSLDIDVNILGYRISKFPAVSMCIISCCVAVALFSATRKYYFPDRDDAAARKWDPGHIISCCYCLLSPTRIIPLVLMEFSTDSRDKEPALWLAVAVMQGFIHLHFFNLFFLRESIGAAIFQEAYKTEVAHRDAVDSARRQAEREVFERAGLYSNGRWTVDPGQNRDSGGRQRLSFPPPVR